MRRSARSSAIDVSLIQFFSTDPVFAGGAGRLTFESTAVRPPAFQLMSILPDAATRRCSAAHAVPASRSTRRRRP